MQPVDIFYYSIAFGFLILVGFISFVSFRIAQTLKHLRSILKRVDDATQEIEIIKDKLKIGILEFLIKILKRFM